MSVKMRFTARAPYLVLDKSGEVVLESEHRDEVRNFVRWHGGVAYERVPDVPDYYCQTCERPPHNCLCSHDS